MLSIFDLYENQNEKLIAEVICFDDGQVVVKWKGDVQSLVIHKNMDEFKNISVTGVRVLWQKI